MFSFYAQSGRDREDAEELTQGLFVHLLEREDFDSPMAERGSFRAWLRTCARHFASNQSRDAAAMRRGGPRQPLSLDWARCDGDGDGDGEIQWAPLDHETPERTFDRRFARELLGVVLARVGEEFDQRDRGNEFAALRGYLESEGGPGFAASAEKLGKTVGAAKVAVHRLRVRFRELLVAEVRQTLLSGDDARDEMQQLLQAFGGGSSESA